MIIIIFSMFSMQVFPFTLKQNRDSLQYFIFTFAYTSMLFLYDLQHLCLLSGVAQNVFM